MRLCYLVAMYFLFVTHATAEYIVEGRIEIDKSWDPVIYLSAINSLSHLNTTSEDFIVNYSRIDSDGRFLITGDNLPDQDRLYRLHLVKNGDPVSTIIIGGREENHIHFIMNGDSHITGIPANDRYLFSNYMIDGHPANAILHDLLNMIEESKNFDGYPSETNRENHLQQSYGRLRIFADTCSHSIVSLLALQEIQLDRDFEIHRKYYLTMAGKLKSVAASPYIDEFLGQVEFLEFQMEPSVKIWFLAILVILFSGVLILFFLFKRNGNKSPDTRGAVPLETSLSYREQRILNLIIKGRTNKEIAQLLHIEVSTVKSHVRNIYSKLGIRSRKEALSYTTDDQRLTTDD